MTVSQGKPLLLTSKPYFIKLQTLFSSLNIEHVNDPPHPIPRTRPSYPPSSSSVY